MNIKLDDPSGRYTASRSLPYNFTINSWKNWCNKNDAELFVLEDLLLPKEDTAICWQRYYLFDILEANEIKAKFENGILNISIPKVEPKVEEAQVIDIE